MPDGRFRHAVVAGASMAGLLAARVLSDHFSQVTVVERDALPRGPAARKGVPQGRHVHVLLPRGREVLEGLFPGLSDALLRAGVTEVDGGRDVAWHHGGGWRSHYQTDIFMLAMSRPMLEYHVTERVRGLPNVRILEQTRLDKLQVENGAVTGATIFGEGESGALDADFLVDATGRGSALSGWLKALGRAPGEPERIPVRLTYTTCQFPRSSSGPDWRALLVTGPAARRAGFAWAIEQDRWLVTLASLFDEPVPRDHDAFRAFAASLPVPDLHDAISAQTPLSDVVRYRFPGSQRWRFERLRNLPAGLIAIGDAVCSFNPVYGQGMTVAALEAEILGRLLSQADGTAAPEGDFVRRWFGEIAGVVDAAWQGVAIEDYRLPELAGARPAHLRPLQWYMDRVHRATHRSAFMAEQFHRVTGFVDPPTALFRPRVMAESLLFGQSAAGREAQPSSPAQ